jgi:hypothetical protein
VSKRELFIDKIEDILSTRPDTLFYLASDDMKICNDFKKMFGHSILTLTDKDFSRSSRKGIEDAIIDLYALSNTNRILGSYWSSFTDVASWLRDIPIEIIK